MPVYTLCAMGDSITRGVGLPAGEPTWLERLEAAFPSVRAVNLASGGETSRQALEKKDALRAAKADITTLQYGMNDHVLTPDGRNQVPPEEFRRNLAALIQAAGKAEVILITNHPVLEGDEEHYYFHRHPGDVYLRSPNEWLEIYNGIVRELAAEGGHSLVDMWAVASRYPREDFLRSRKNTPLPAGDDGVHPHLLGVRLYAEHVGMAVGRILRRKEAEEK